MTDAPNRREKGQAPAVSRREFLRLAGTATAGAVLSACTPSQPGTGRRSGEKVQLVYQDWRTDWFPPMAQQMLEEFHATHPNIRVFYTPDPENLETQMLLDMQAGAAPDVFQGCCTFGSLGFRMVFSLKGDNSPRRWAVDCCPRRASCEIPKSRTFFPIWAQKGYTLDLRPYVEADLNRATVDDWDPVQYQAFFLPDGRQYGLPKYHGALALYYNKDLFDEYGVNYPDDTWTHDDYMAAMHRLAHDRDGDGQIDLWGSMLDVSWDRIQVHVNAWGGHFVNPDDPTRCQMATPRARRETGAPLHHGGPGNPLGAVRTPQNQGHSHWRVGRPERPGERFRRERCGDSAVPGPPNQAAIAIEKARLHQEEIKQQRLGQELHVAQLVQQRLLPKDVPARPGWQVTTHYQPARAVGGDFYDFLDLPDDRFGFVIGDVSGKGVPAALMMAATRSVLRAAGQRLVSPGQVLQAVNDLICPDMPPNMFVTCLYAVLDPASGKLQYASAGQNPPFLLRDGSVMELPAAGVPLGLVSGMHYDERETQLNPGEYVLFSSDGLVEAHNPGREMFGFQRLQAVIAAYAGCESLIDSLLAELATFAGSNWEPEDDITLVVFERTSSS